MSATSPLRQRLRRQTGEAGRRHAAVAAEIARRIDRPPEPGDLFVLSETAEHSVEWAILDRDPADPRRLLAVPADASSLIGSADVAVPEDLPSAPLSLRCGYSVWLDAEAFDPEMRTGFLEPETLERARRKRDLVERGVATGSVLEREVDGEAEYREWLAVLERARAAAPERPAEPEQESAETSGIVLPFRRPWHRLSMSGPLAAAASVLLVVTLGLGGRLVRVTSDHEVVVAEQRDELARLEQERRRLAEDHRQDLARLQDEQQRTAREHRQRIAKLEASTRPKAMTNLPLIILAAGQLRGDGDRIEVAPDASHLMLILQVDDPEVYSRYRLDLREQASKRRVWRDSGLEASRLSELTVLLPRSLVPDGQYELRLYGLREGRAEKLMERILTIASE